VLSQNIFIIIYPIFSFSKYFESTEGIVIFSLTTSFSIKSFSPCLIILNFTFDPAGHFINQIASYKSLSLSSISPAFTIMSHDKIHAFFAGEPDKTISTATQSSFFSTIAPIHSKSQDNVSSNCFLSFLVINSLCLSQRESTIHFIIPSTITSFFIPSKE
jgi:hypothetical protein